MSLWCCAACGAGRLVNKLRPLQHFEPTSMHALSFFWEYDPWKCSVIVETPKRHVLGRKGVVWRINRQDWLRNATCRRDEESKKKKRNRDVIFHASRTTYIERQPPNLACGVGSVVLVTFESNILVLLVTLNKSNILLLVITFLWK